MRKNDIVTVRIEDIGSNGEGIGTGFGETGNRRAYGGCIGV